MSSIVTGEAVVLELRPASFAARALSSIIDVFAQLIVLFGVLLLFGQTLGESVDPALGRTLILTIVVLVMVGAPVAVETLTRGKSLGRLAMGLRIVRDDGGAVRFRHCLIRGMTAVLEIYLTAGSLAFIVALFNEKSKRVGDIMAGTYALRERVSAPPPAQVLMPPSLRAWAGLADIGRLPDALSRRVSRFLTQSSRLSPQSRATLAADLAAEVSAFVSPQPPPGTFAEDYLSAVMAERRNRSYVSMTRQRERTEHIGQRLHRLPFDR
ncbi:RDD family protein [Arthrobacter sp. zg-Y820]|uniref:RDD family protein n=1 Tax=unclassified Arthrobacter TaxID=235627 RepID=UPI00253FDA23|nr:MULTISPECIES: RDD family protein [unclassified Arthrobacter]MCC9197962.1 RDD family protein [Arthrobacter sp. zg-Y820]MDK1280829.1 RDD family protein [Arthrobacter sp. zg.Y820]WIB10311.1 RDD family protein [Arthrobacter sp. zg-Y820]